MNRIEELKKKALSYFKEGDMVYDKKYKEVFEFELRCDYIVVANYPERFRKATEEEINDPNLKP